MKNFLILFTILTFKINAAATAPGGWMVWFGSQYLKKNVFLLTEAQYRSFHFPDDLEQVLLRTGVGLEHASGKGHALGGFCYMYGEPYASDGTKSINREYRPFQQAFLRQQQGRWIFFHRFRLEQRFMHGSYSNRLRYFFSMNYLLNKESFEKNALYLSAYNEVFLQTHKASVFDRNRIYSAIGWVPKKGLRLEMGYMSQIFSASSRAQFMLVLFQQMNFYKEK